MKPSNLARFNFEKSEELTNEQLEKLLMVKLGQKKNLQKRIEDYKQSVIDAYLEKKATQHEYSSYWRMQMSMNEIKRSEAVTSEKEHPDPMWTIEGPTRKA